MSIQGETLYRHIVNYLSNPDPELAEMFKRAMSAAGYPQVSVSAALEAVFADFLAGHGSGFFIRPHRNFSFDTDSGEE
jgi:hypothetical protein